MKRFNRCWPSLLAALALGASAPAAAEPADPILDALLQLRDAQRAQPTGPVEALHGLPAWQAVPLFTVLDEREDADPERYVMTHPWFAFAWSDGRLLVVDTGLPLDEADGFGAPTEWLGADPMRCDPGAWAPLLAPGRRIGAVVFTHLHVDHTLGVRALCNAGPVPVRISPEQESSDSRFEASGREQLREEAPGCVRFEPWAVEALPDADPAVAELSGFPGAFRASVPGHTPGSQLIVAFVRAADGVRGVVAAGDVVNHRLGFERDIAKPWWYRWFIVREDDDAQRRYRRLLKALDAAGFEVWVNHDLRVPERDAAGAACEPRAGAEPAS